MYILTSPDKSLTLSPFVFLTATPRRKEGQYSSKYKELDMHISLCYTYTYAYSVNF